MQYPHAQNYENQTPPCPRAPKCPQQQPWTTAHTFAMASPLESAAKDIPTRFCYYLSKKMYKSGVKDCPAASILMHALKSRPEGVMARKQIRLIRPA